MNDHLSHYINIWYVTDQNNDSCHAFDLMRLPCIKRFLFSLFAKVMSAQQGCHFYGPYFDNVQQGLCLNRTDSTKIR